MDEQEIEEPEIIVTSLHQLPGVSIVEILDVIFATTSSIALGLNKQSTRLERVMDTAMLELKIQAEMLGADAVVGLQFALNNSEGAGALVGNLGGSSEAVLLMGTAVRTKPL